MKARYINPYTDFGFKTLPAKRSIKTCSWISFTFTFTNYSRPAPDKMAVV